MRSISAAERRSRLGLRHHLAKPSSGLVAAAGSLGGLHSSDPATVYLAARARIPNLRREDLEVALYDRRTLVRMLGMRRTMFVIPSSGATTMHRACTVRYVASERRRLIGYLEDQGVTNDGSAWLDDVCTRALLSIRERGEATAAEIKEDVPEFALKISFGAGTKWAGNVGLSTRVLFLLATDGRIIRGRPRGSWLSSQYRWVSTADWLGFDLANGDEPGARSSVLRTWLRSFGPATEADARWWTGWTAAKTRAALADVRATKVDLDGIDGFVLADDVGPQPDAEPWAALLPSLDPTTMGWKDRDWYLGELAPLLFDRNGNAGPTVWWNGRVVGGWAQRGSGDIAVRVFEDVGSDARHAIDQEVAELASWLGDSIVTPRFRTPTERELVAG